ncbi:MAG: hypothetical protein L0Y54_18005 [Sporichthyaceae bacterium]|nr:hypothetical protein [Sporichthyaceae bacterium]
MIWHRRHLAQASGSGLTQRAHSGLVRVPPCMGAAVPQPQQRVHQF